MTSSKTEIRKFLRKNNLFKGLTEQQFEQLAFYIKEITVKENETIIHEHEISDDVYIVKEGEVEISRFDKEIKESLRLTLLGPGSVVGEISLLDNAPRSASVRTTKPSVLFVLSISQLRSAVTHEVVSTKVPQKTKTSVPELAIYSRLVQNIAKELGQRLRTTNDVVIEALKRELIHAKARAALSKFIINTLVLLSCYIFVLQALASWQSQVASSALFSIPLTGIFAVVLLHMMKQSGYPLSLYGLTAQNWRRATVESIIFTLPLLLVIVAYKWLLINYSSTYAGSPLFNLSFDLSAFAKEQGIPDWLGFLIIILYVVFIPLQELVVRGALQSSFEKLLVGGHKTFWSIVLSNLLFSVTHVHLSLGFGIIVYLPGLFWGWLYARHHTLVGVAISHIMVGVWAIFIVGLL